MAGPPSDSRKDEAARKPAAPKAPARPGFVWKEYHGKLIAVLFFLALICLFLVRAPWATDTTEQSQNQTTPPLGELLFGGFGASFLLLSIVMGVALIGGLFLAKEDPADEDEKHKEGGGKGGGPK
jgi:NADH:ubiquinone oxidoreductase subunit 6 (subunit J)